MAEGNKRVGSWLLRPEGFPLLSRAGRAVCLRIDPVFEFFQIRYYLIERWSFPKDHLAHVPVVTSNLSDVGVRRTYPKASGPGQIVTRRSFPEEDFLVLDNACQQPEVLYRKLPVLVPLQTREVIVMPRDPWRHLARMEDRME